MNRTWKRIGWMAVGVSLVGALALGGVALAQTPDESDDATPTPKWGLMQRGWDFGGMMHGWLNGFFGGMHGGRGGMMGFGGHHMGGWGQDIVAEQLGITVDELTAALSDGETTVADLAEANGVELQTIVDAVLAPTADHLAVMVNYGRISQTEADQILALLETRLTEQFTTARTPQGMVATVADELGLTVAELTEALSDGKTTVADLAEANGVELQTIVDAILAPVADHLAVEVEYGRLTQEQADAILERSAAAMTTWLSQPYGAPMGRGFGPHGGPGMRFEFRFEPRGPRFQFENRGSRMYNNGTQQQAPLLNGFSL